MAMTDEIRRTLSDPKPLYALAGAGDLAAEKLKDAPTLAADAAQAVTSLAGRIAAGAPEQLAKVQALIADVPAALDPKSARDTLRESADKVAPQALRERAQSIALAQVGRVLEVAGKAVETYDELAERGKTVVARYRGEETVITGVTVVVEQVVEEDEGDGAVFVGEPAGADDMPGGAFDEAAFEAAAYDRVREPGKETKADAESDTEAAPKKSAASASTAKKTASASAPRKRAASSKTAAPKSSTDTGSGSSAAKPAARKTSASKSTKN